MVLIHPPHKITFIGLHWLCCPFLITREICMRNQTTLNWAVLIDKNEQFVNSSCTFTKGNHLIRVICLGIGLHSSLDSPLIQKPGC